MRPKVQGYFGSEKSVSFFHSGLPYMAKFAKKALHQYGAGIGRSPSFDLGGKLHSSPLSFQVPSQRPLPKHHLSPVCPLPASAAAAEWSRMCGNEPTEQTTPAFPPLRKKERQGRGEEKAGRITVQHCATFSAVNGDGDTAEATAQAATLVHQPRIARGFSLPPPPFRGAQHTFGGGGGGDDTVFASHHTNAIAAMAPPPPPPLSS